MKIKYKKVKVAMPHCGDCGELLSGNGSIATPYRCKCGTWEVKDWHALTEYTLKEDKHE